MNPALALFEYDSLAAGIAAGDAMAKRAPLDALYAGTVQPGRFLVLAGGPVAAVDEAWTAAHFDAAVLPDAAIRLPDVEPRIVRRLCGEVFEGPVEALGIVETLRAPAAVEAADAGLKGAAVELLELRLSDGLGGKGYLLFAGAVADVEAAVAMAEARVGRGALAASAVIPQLHPEMLENLRAEARFGPRLRSHGT